MLLSVKKYCAPTPAFTYGRTVPLGHVSCGPMLIGSEVVGRAHSHLNASADGFAERNSKGFLPVAEKPEIGAQAERATLVESELVRAVDAIPESDVLLQAAERAALCERDAAGAAALELAGNVFARRAGVLSGRGRQQRRR